MAPQYPHVAIERAAWIDTASQTGRLGFVVNLHEAPGDFVVVWDGPDYYGAVLAAEAWRRDGLPVVDPLA